MERHGESQRGGKSQKKLLLRVPRLRQRRVVDGRGRGQLLREGATYFTSAEDILDDLHWLDNPPAVRQNSGCSGRTQTFTPEEEAVFSALKPGRLGFEQIADRSGLSPAALMSTLTILQIKGMIEALPGKKYQLKDSDSQHYSDPEE